MIQPLRSVHRGVVVTLAFVLPVILVAALSARHRALPLVAPAKQVPASVRLLSSSDRLWQTHAIQTAFYADSNTPESLYVTLQPAQDLGEPDLLLYWATSQPSGDSLPAGAKLLGTFAADKIFALPRDLARGGHLVLYSLAHQSVVDTAAVENLP
jgi:hypothetical protein